MRGKIVKLALSLLVLAGIVLSMFAWMLLHRTPGHYFDSNGASIFYTDEGQGEPVILIHGVGANADLNWRRPGVTKRLARNFRVIALDLRGHGLSAQPTDPAMYGMEMVEDVVRLMDHLNLEKAHIAGYSLGGFILEKLLVVHPERVQSAALCAAGWKNPEDPADIPSPYRPPQKTAPLKLSRASMMPSFEKGSFFHSLKEWVGPKLVNKPALKAMKKAYPALVVTMDELKSVKMPVICFIGSRDGFYYLAKDLNTVNPAVELVELDGANHFTTPLYGDFQGRLESFFRAHSLFDAPAPAPDAASEATLLTWNIQMLPARLGCIVEPLNRMQHERAPEIVNYLNGQNYDLLCLQEVFDKTSTRILLEGLRREYPYAVLPQRRPWRTQTNGVLFMSRFPIRLAGYVPFDELKGVEHYVSKGCTLVECVKDGVRFQIGGTHFPTGKSAYKHAASRKTGENLLIPLARPQVPQFLMGDMNVASGTEDFDILLKATRMSQWPVNDPRPFTTEPENTWRGRGKTAQIDHVLLNPNGTGTAVTNQVIQRAKADFGGKSLDLADHYGVAARVLIKN